MRVSKDLYLFLWNKNSTTVYDVIHPAKRLHRHKLAGKQSAFFPMKSYFASIYFILAFEQPVFTLTAYDILTQNPIGCLILKPKENVVP